MIFEEWLWEVLTALGRYLSHLLHLERFELWLSKASPAIALAAFLIPFIVIAPLGLIALVLFIRGLFLEGVLLEIFAKLLATLLLARVFALTRPQLMTFRWFFMLYTKITGWLFWAHNKIAQTAVYKAAKIIKEKIQKLKWRANP